MAPTRPADAQRGLLCTGDPHSGTVPVDNVIGKPRFIAWPPSPLGRSGRGEPADDPSEELHSPAHLASANGDPEVFGAAHAGVGAVPRRSGTGGRRRRSRPWCMRGSARGGGVCARTQPTRRSLAALDDSKELGTRRNASGCSRSSGGMRWRITRPVHPVGGGGPARRARGQYRGHAAGGGRPDGAARLCTVRWIPGTRPADAPRFRWSVVMRPRPVSPRPACWPR